VAKDPIKEPHTDDSILPENMAPLIITVAPFVAALPVLADDVD
jgi:hypothetical protein